METIYVALITVSGTIIVAAISYYLNERAKRHQELQENKFSHYAQLFSAISDLAIEGTNKTDANIRFAGAVNTVSLIASQEVIMALMAFHDQIKFSNEKNRSITEHDRLLKDVILSIRRDIGISKKDDSSTFKFHLIGTQPK